MAIRASAPARSKNLPRRLYHSGGQLKDGIKLASTFGEILFQLVLQLRWNFPAKVLHHRSVPGRTRLDVESTYQHFVVKVFAWDIHIKQAK